MPTSPIEYLRHILDETKFLDEHTKRLTHELFLQDTVLKRAFVRSLEIIGEATNNLPAEFRSRHAHVEWRDMADKRNRLIHGYFSVDYDIVWDVVTNEIPGIRFRFAGAG